MAAPLLRGVIRSYEISYAYHYSKFTPAKLSYRLRWSNFILSKQQRTLGVCPATPLMGPSPFISFVEKVRCTKPRGLQSKPLFRSTSSGGATFEDTRLISDFFGRGF